MTFDADYSSCFEDGITPKIKKIVHNHDNPYWFFNHHMHTDLSELVFVKKGCGTYTINNIPYKLHKNDLIIVSPHMTHSVLSDKDNPFDVYNCAITNIRLKKLPPNHIISPDTYPVIKTAESGNFYLQVLEEILSQRMSGLESYDMVCNLLITALIIKTFQLDTGLPSINNKHNNSQYSLAHQVLIYISENYHEPITLKSLSEQFHISQGSISHAMTSTYQISPISHLISCRITASLWQLIATEKTVTAISQEVGYDNARHFTNIFIKRVGLKPLEFRAKYQSEHQNI